MSAFKIQFNTGLMGRRNTCRFILIRECTIEGLPSADLPLCVVGNLEWKKREAARGTMGREKIKERPFPLYPSSSPLPPPPRANSIFRLYLLFLLGHPVGISEEERARGIQYGHRHWRIQDQIAVKTRFPGYVMTKETETLRMNPFEKLRKHPWEGLRRQDHANPVNILATREGKMGFPALVQQKSSLYRHVINPLLTKLVRSTNLANITPSWPNKLGQF